MGEQVATDDQMRAQVGKIDADLSRIMQMLRVMATPGVEAEPKGLKFLEDLVFVVSCDVMALGSAVEGRIGEVRGLTVKARAFISAVQADDAEIRELVSLVRRAAQLIPGARTAQESAQLLETVRAGLAEIEERTLRDGPRPAASNVLQFTRKAAADVASASPEGGAA